jgi:hypothetical protein
MADTQTQDPEQQQISPPPDPNDPNNINVEVPPQATDQPPPTQPGRQARSGGDPQVFTPEEVEKIRQEERSRYGTLSSQLDDLNQEIAKYRQADEERVKAEEKARRDTEKVEKKKAEEEMELRDLIAKKDQEWEAKLEQERQDREKALALLEQERRHASLQNYLAQRMMESGELIAPQLRKLVGGNTEQEIDTKIQELVEITGSIVGDTQQYMAQVNAQRPTVGVTAPPIGPAETAATTRTLTPDDLKALTPEEYADQRESLLRAASASRRQ